MPLFSFPINDYKSILKDPYAMEQIKKVMRMPGVSMNAVLMNPLEYSIDPRLDYETMERAMKDVRRNSYCADIDPVTAEFFGDLNASRIFLRNGVPVTDNGIVVDIDKFNTLCPDAFFGSSGGLVMKNPEEKKTGWQRIASGAVLVSLLVGAACVSTYLLGYASQEHQMPFPAEKFLYFDGIGNDNDVQVWKASGNDTFFYKAHMLVDADGSPRAYHPLPDEQLGLDSLSFAGKDGNWWAVATDEKGMPYIQDESDPYPGFYVSMTALYDASNPDPSDPAKYIDSEKIPYLVLPEEVYKSTGARLGDIGFAINTKNNMTSCAVLGDLNIHGMMGEGSIKLAKNLGIDSNPRHDGTGSDDSVIYIFFPGSGEGEGKLRTAEEIEAECHRLMDEFGGWKKLYDFYF